MRRLSARLKYILIRGNKTLTEETKKVIEESKRGFDKDNAKEAREIGGIDIVPVSTVSEAIKILSK